MTHQSQTAIQDDISVNLLPVFTVCGFLILYDPVSFGSAVFQTENEDAGIQEQEGEIKSLCRFTYFNN